MRFGTVAVVGRSNVGKSTFLNRVLGEPLAIVSPKPQTTRESLLGVVHRPDAQIALLDTPGVHRPRSELGRRMNATAREAARGADVLIFVTDPPEGTGPEGLHGGDAALLEGLSTEIPVVLAINKVDRLRDKRRLLPMIEAYVRARDFVAAVPMAALTGDGVDRVLDEVADVLPEGPRAYSDDVLTDRPTAWLAAEYVREQILVTTRAEVPHAAAVTIDAWEETDGLARISATIHVEKVGQRKVLLGEHGTRLRSVGVAARRRIEELLEKQVHLELFVRVTERWKDTPRRLAELGYEGPTRSTERKAP